MASKRPSYVSIRARRRNIIEGMETRGLNQAQAAKEFGVTRQQLKTFIESKPKDFRSNYNRSPGYAKLYREGERSETRRVLGVKRIRQYEAQARKPQYKVGRFEPKGTILKPAEISRQQTVRLIRFGEGKNGQARAEWANYTRDNGLPSSIKTIQMLHNEGRISDTRYNEILKVWDDIYHVGDVKMNEYLEEVDVPPWD